ncbi:transcription factor hes-1 -like [Dermatophagoides farinae]|uniref:Transcription factor hes-1 -like n=1 Tax=Dermatophagoides farinae TaxID=6954 RepID=A0A9D4SJL6_DERFA|nr:transcription factor hes-1 -like [Dermatophagoides farinae]
MTKIAYIRATNRQQQQQSSPSMPIKSMNQSIILQPSIPSMMMNHQQHQQQQNGVRISKPLMEKRRRARINQCLSQLKTIVVDSAGQYTQNNKCKLEKADILELTVNYVKQLHQEHMEQKQQSTGKIDDDQYMAGYSECVRQMCEYLTKNQSKISYESIMKHDDSQQPRRQQDCFDDDENVWRPW